MKNKFFSVLYIVVFLSSLFTPSVYAGEYDVHDSAAEALDAIDDVHIPIVSAPFGFVKGAYLGTRGVAGALGDEDDALFNLVGFIIGGPIGAVTGTFIGLFGGPYSDISDARSHARVDSEENISPPVQ